MPIREGIGVLAFEYGAALTKMTRHSEYGTSLREQAEYVAQQRGVMSGIRKALRAFDIRFTEIEEHPCFEEGREYINNALSK